MTVSLTGLMIALQASAAIALDHYRVIYNGGEKSISLSISNENKKLSYLAQTWMEDVQGTKITSPLTETASTMQPPYRARFVAESDASNPDIVAVNGASGIGLRLRDSRGKTVMLSVRVTRYCSTPAWTRWSLPWPRSGLTRRLSPGCTTRSLTSV